MTDVFKATYKDQYVQSTYIKAGTFTFQARIMFQSDSPDGKYSISFTDEDGGVHVVNLNWQIEPNIWCEVVQTIELERPMVEFSLMASPLFSGESILIGLPQHEEGSTKSTPRANPLDESEAIKDEIDLVRTYISSQVDILEDRIVLKVGEYQIGGKNFLRNFDGRFGTDFWGEGVELVDENGDSIPVYILSVTAPTPISVYVNSTPEVPEMIKLVLDNGTSVNVPVDWGVIDTSVLGEQSIQGIYELPEGVTGDMPDVFLKVLVIALTVVSVTPLAQITVDQYRVPSLPTTIQLNLNNQTSIDAPVTWSERHTNTAGTFELTAIYELPEGITGYKPTVKITLVVNEVADTGTFIDVKPYLLNATAPGGYPSGYTEGSDSQGDYVYTGNSEAIINELIPYITSTSRLFVKFSATSYEHPWIYIYSDDSISYYGFIGYDGIRWANVPPVGDLVRISAQFNSAKLYFIEIRNDGSTPPWYIG